MNDVLYSLILIILIGSAHVKFAGPLKDDVYKNKKELERKRDMRLLHVPN